MYKWLIDILLKNGERVSGLVICEHKNSGDVARSLINTDNPNTFFGIKDVTETHNILVKIGEVVVLDISVYKD